MQMIILCSITVDRPDWLRINLFFLRKTVSVIVADFADLRTNFEAYKSNLTLFIIVHIVPNFLHKIWRESVLM